MMETILHAIFSVRFGSGIPDKFYFGLRPLKSRDPLRKDVNGRFTYQIGVHELLARKVKGLKRIELNTGGWRLEWTEPPLFAVDSKSGELTRGVEESSRSFEEPEPET